MKTFMMIVACGALAFGAPKAKVVCKQGVPDGSRYFCTVTLSAPAPVEMAFYTKDVQVAIPAGRITFSITESKPLKHWKLVEYGKYVSTQK